MLSRRLIRDRALLGALLSGALILAAYVLAERLVTPDQARLHHLLTVAPWYCDVLDPEDQSLVVRSVETFHQGGTLDGLTRLEDRSAGKVLLAFRYRGVWEFDDPWLTEAINDYRYLEVDGNRFSTAELAAIEAEFAEPERSLVHALSEGQLVYGAERSLYRCHRRAPAASA